MSSATNKILSTYILPNLDWDFKIPLVFPWFFFFPGVCNEGGSKISEPSLKAGEKGDISMSISTGWWSRESLLVKSWWFESSWFLPLRFLINESSIKNGTVLAAVFNKLSSFLGGLSLELDPLLKRTSSFGSPLGPGGESASKWQKIKKANSRNSFKISRIRT